MTNRKLGKLAPDHSKPALMLADHLTAPLVAPPVVDWIGRVSTWPMYGNDQIGDCVWASFGHAIQAWTTYASGQTVTLPDQAILKGYADVTGWRPDDPSTDQGTLMQDAMSYWRKSGLGGHKILAFAKVNHRDLAELRVAIAVFGAVLVGIEFPHVAMEQFDQGKTWTPVPDDGGIDGGHAIHVGEYDTTLFELTTWGRVQRMTTSFVQKYADEAWVVITPEWLAATGGVSPAGLDLYGLGEALRSLTGTANPFPKPDNPPAPPTPPVPPQPEPDLEFAKILKPWAAKRHLGDTAAIARAAKAWLAQRGL